MLDQHHTIFLELVDRDHLIRMPWPMLHYSTQASLDYRRSRVSLLYAWDRLSTVGYGGSRLTNTPVPRPILRIAGIHNHKDASL